MSINDIRNYVGKFIRKLRRLSLLPLVLPHFRKKTDDITVIIVVRNRYDERLINALKSIRNQTYDQKLINIAVVDYDSDRELVADFLTTCQEFEINYIQVRNKPVWNKSHALNIAIKKIKTKYILSSDVDIVFEQNYIAESIKELQKKPFQVILCGLLDLPQMDIEDLSFESLKELSKPRYKNSAYLGPIPLCLTIFFQKIRGYDEYYTLWGKEDDDLIKRFYMIGVDRKTLHSSYHLHQWHPKHEGIEEKDFSEQLEKNSRYFEKARSVIRNSGNWGEDKKTPGKSI